MWQAQLAVRRGFNWLQPEGSVKYPGVLGYSLPVYKHVFMRMLLLDKCIQDLMHAGTRLKKNPPQNDVRCQVPLSYISVWTMSYVRCTSYLGESKLQMPPAKNSPPLWTSSLILMVTVRWLTMACKIAWSFWSSLLRVSLCFGNFVLITVGMRLAAAVCIFPAWEDLDSFSYDLSTSIVFIVFPLLFF